MNRMTIGKRAKEAASLLRQIEGILKATNGIPSFTGKARFIDKVINARNQAHNLKWELDRDAEELK